MSHMLDKDTVNRILHLHKVQGLEARVRGRLALAHLAQTSNVNHWGLIGAGTQRKHIVFPLRDVCTRIQNLAMIVRSNIVLGNRAGENESSSRREGSRSSLRGTDCLPTEVLSRVKRQPLFWSSNSCYIG